MAGLCKQSPSCQHSLFFFFGCTLINSATSGPRAVSKVETQRLALRQGDHLRAAVLNGLDQPLSALFWDCWTPSPMSTFLFFLINRILGILGSAKSKLKISSFPSLPCVVKISDLQGKVPWRFLGKFSLPNIDVAPPPFCLPLSRFCEA